MVLMVGGWEAAFPTTPPAVLGSFPPKTLDLGILAVCGLLGNGGGEVGKIAASGGLGGQRKALECLPEKLGIMGRFGLGRYLSLLFGGGAGWGQDRVLRGLV